MERGVASRDCGANRSAGGPGPRPSGRRALTRAGCSSAPVPLPETGARVPGRKSPRRSAERASRLQRDGPRFAHAVRRASHARHNTRVRLSALRHPLISGGGCEQKGRTPTHERGAGTKKTALCGIARWPAPPYPKEARRAVSKDARPRIDLRNSCFETHRYAMLLSMRMRDFAWLFDIVKWDDGERFMREPRSRVPEPPRPTGPDRAGGAKATSTPNLF